MNPNLYCTKSAADKLGVHYLRMLKRCEHLKIEPQKQNNIDYWSEEQIKQLAFYLPRKIRRDAINPHSKDKIIIIDLFKKLKNNTAVEIHQQTNFSIYFIHRTLNEFISTKQIIVESKMNNI